MLGPAIGPIAGGFIAENTTWRWVFYATSVTAAFIQIVAFFFLPETYAPVILCWKAKKLRKETGNQDYRTESERKRQSPGTILSTALIRPFRLLTTQPIVQILALYMAFGKWHNFRLTAVPKS